LLEGFNDSTISMMGLAVLLRPRPCLQTILRQALSGLSILMHVVPFGYALALRRSHFDALQKIGFVLQIRLLRLSDPFSAASRAL
jgi:hypothetical protein